MDIKFGEYQIKNQEVDILKPKTKAHGESNPVNDVHNLKKIKSLQAELSEAKKENEELKNQLNLAQKYLPSGWEWDNATSTKTENDNQPPTTTGDSKHVNK